MSVDEYSIVEIEKKIIECYNDDMNENVLRALMEARKNIINHVALKNQKQLLPTILEFDDILNAALRKSYNDVLCIWNDLKGRTDYGDDLEVRGMCFFDDEYPPMHPVQKDDRQDLWYAIRSDVANPLYGAGVTGCHILFCQGSEDSVDDCIGPRAGGFELGLKPESVGDITVSQALYWLGNVTNFALTDLIYVRNFHTEITVETSKKIRIN